MLVKNDEFVYLSGSSDTLHHGGADDEGADSRIDRTVSGESRPVGAAALSANDSSPNIVGKLSLEVYCEERDRDKQRDRKRSRAEMRHQRR